MAKASMAHLIVIALMLAVGFALGPMVTGAISVNPVGVHGWYVELGLHGEWYWEDCCVRCYARDHSDCDPYCVLRWFGVWWVVWDVSDVSWVSLL